MTRAIAYIRVSTDEQADNGGSLDSQREQVRAACAERGWEVADVAEDAGYSARTLSRPGLTRALEALSRSGADALVAAKLDRLSRSVLDFASLMERSQQEDWALVALDCAVDTTTPAGEAMAGVLAIFAQFERRLISQRTKDGLAARRAAGVRLGRPPSLPDAVRDDIVASRAGGASYAAIAQALNGTGVPTAQGGRQWWPSTVQAVVAAASRRR